MRPRHTLHALLALALAASCGGQPATAPVTPELVVARDRAAEYGLIGAEWARESYEALRPFADREDAAGEDLLRITQALLALHEVEEASVYLDRAEKAAAHAPAVLWCRYRLARIDNRTEEALGYLNEILATLPEDIPTRVAKVTLLSELDRSVETLALCEELMEVPEEYAGSWRVAVLYRYAQLLLTLGRREEGERYLNEFKRLTGPPLEIKSPGEPAHQPGTLGQIRPHTPGALQPKKPAVSEFSLGEPRFVADTAGQTGMLSFRRHRGQVTEDTGAQLSQEAWRWEPAPLDLACWGAFGLALIERLPDGSWKPTALVQGPVLDALAFDRTNAEIARPGRKASDEESGQETGPGDSHTDLIFVLRTDSGVEVRLLENLDGSWRTEHPLIFTAGTYAGHGRLVAVDYDHDGDLDLVAGVDTRVRVFRNDGFDLPAGSFTEVTDEVGFPRGDLRPITEDLDGDNDVDFLFHDETTGAISLWDNLRGGRFEDASARLPGGVTCERLAVADLDGDSLPDLAAFGVTLRIYRRDELRRWRPALEWPLSAAPTGPVSCTDWDVDGLTDLVWPVDGETAAAGVLAAGFEGTGTPFTLGGADSASAVGPATLVLDDVDGDLDLDLLRLDGGGFTEYPREDSHPALLLGLRGEKDNALAVGAIVEARQGLEYRRIYWRGTALLLGTGDPDPIDVLRVTWPNGAQQSFFDVPQGERFQIWQRRGLVGSCPFLYTWNGETFEFISDVLGITPLGLPMAPGVFVPPDHDEFVLVRGGQLAARDGFYEIQLTEELREVTYLDRIRLDVVDHPAQVEVFPNERFSFPPFPEHHTHTVVDAAAPTAVVDGDGRDWTAELRTSDGEVARPFVPLYGQFQGLAPMYSLELGFPVARVRDAAKLRLLMNGWLVWTDASVNVASARHPQHAFVPPTLQVPDGEGGWRDAGPPLGFPAGKLKTMVVDVTTMLNRRDPRIRLVSTLEIYWDSIRLATDGDSSPTVTTAIDPSSALLWERGFSAPITVESGRGMEWFEWDRMTPHARWNQHPGFYTRLGETLPLVTEIDDRFVILGAGDALRVRFDASRVPPLKEGWTRDFLVFLDGWAKDRDPNTAEALFVEPLPFHGMSGYPYGPDESFPDTPEHRAWRHEWNTRPAQRLIPPLNVPRN